MAIKYSDETLMPFGKFKGTKLANVPASYLLWLYKQDQLEKRLAYYIRENMDILKPEAAKEDKARLKERDRGLNDYPQDNGFGA